MLPPIKTKRCARCRLPKPLSEFYRFSKAKDGRQSYCKSCRHEYIEDWKRANPERVRDSNRSSNEKQKEERNLKRVKREAKPPLSPLAEEWLGGYHNKNTRSSYETDIRAFFDWCKAQELDPLALRRVEGNLFLSHLIELGLSNQTVSRKLASTRQFYEYLCAEERIEKNPLHFIKYKCPPNDPHRPWLDEGELKALMATATLSNSPLRDFLLCGLLGLNGLRVTEVTTARIENLAVDGGHRVLWVQRKGNKKTKVPLDPRLAAVMDEYLDWLGNPKEGPLVVSVSRDGLPRMPLRPMERVSVGKRLRKLAVTARINPNIAAHSLRRSFATLALGKGVPLHFVQAAMAHSNPATTMVYNRDAENLDHNPTFMLWDALLGEVLPRPPVAAPESPPIRLPDGWRRPPGLPAGEEAIPLPEG
jgi:integrase/recombinase XerD